MFDLKNALRLYVIPDRKTGAPLSLPEQARLAVEGGATAIQLRGKEADGRELLEIAREMASFCRRSGVLFIVNDRLDVALLSGADGVHLGQSDLPPGEARRLAPRPFIVGVSVHTPEEAGKAEVDGADYLGVGAVFGTGSKDDAKIIGPEGLRRVVEKARVPLVAIGGITRDNLPDVMKCGVDGFAVISAAVCGHVRERTGILRSLVDSSVRI